MGERRAAHEDAPRRGREGGGERERFFNPLDYTRSVLITPSRTRLSFAVVAMDKNRREPGVTSLPHVVIYICVHQLHQVGRDEMKTTGEREPDSDFILIPQVTREGQ